jgi:hypothetical protein
MFTISRSADSISSWESAFFLSPSRGIPKDLVTQIQRDFNISHFVETGTYMGATAKWAAGVFPHVITIERSESCYNQLVPEHAAYPNIDFIQGDSREELRVIVPLLKGPAVFWLDGHWSGGETYGISDECPAMKEIDEITRSSHDHFVFIDDARLFMSPPPRPHARDQWPTLDQVFDALRKGRDRYLVICADVIASSPRKAETMLAQYYQQAATQYQDMWNRLVDRQRKQTSKNRRQLFGEGLSLVAKALLPARRTFR